MKLIPAILSSIAVLTTGFVGLCAVVDIVTAPKAAVTAPKAAVTAPKVAVTAPKVAVAAPKAAVTAPKAAVTAPKVAVTAPKVAVTAPKASKLVIPSDCSINIQIDETFTQAEINEFCAPKPTADQIAAQDRILIDANKKRVAAFNANGRKY